MTLPWVVKIKTTELMQKGNITNVQLTNFMTYDAAEFNPDPGLNLILGCNGAGKSSLVCAIALGLGASPRDLGRSTHTSAFVKHGKKFAKVKISLFPDLTVEREIRVNEKKKESNRDSGFSKFRLNGRDISNKSLQKRLAEEGINVSSLCQVLPQDRVGDFSKYKPEELLKATVSSIISEEFAHKLDTLYSLKEKRINTKMGLEESSERKEKLTGLKKRLDEEIVELDKRKKIEEKITVLENLKPWLELQESKQELDLLKEREKAVKSAIRAGKRTADKFNKNCKVNIKESQLQVRKEVLSFANFAKIGRERARFIEELKDLIQARDGFEKRKQKKEDEVQACRNALRNIKDLDSLIDEIKVKAKEEARLEYQELELSSELEDLQKQARFSKRKCQKLENELDKMKHRKNGFENKMMQMLNPRMNFDKTLGEVDRLKSELTGNVCGPAFLLLKVKDDEISKMIEKFIPADTLLTYFVDNKRDESLLQDVTNINLLSLDFEVKARSNRASTLSELNTDVGVDLHEFGVRGFGSEFLEVDESLVGSKAIAERIRTALIRTNDVFRNILFASRILDEDESKRSQLIKVLSERKKFTPLKIISPRTSYTISKSEYTGDILISEDPWKIIEAGKGLRGQRLLDARLRPSNDGFEAINKELEECRSSCNVMVGRSEKAKVNKIECTEQLSALKQDVKKLKDEKSVFLTLSSKLETATTELEEINRQSMEEVLQSIKNTHFKIQETFSQQFKAINKLNSERLNHEKNMETTTKAILDAANKSGLHTLQKVIKASNTRTIKQWESSLESVNRNLQRIKEEIRTKKRVLETKAPLREFKKQFEELHVTNLHSLQAELALCYEEKKRTISNPAKYQEFEDCKRDLELVTQKVDDLTNELAEAETALTELQLEFETKVEAVVQKIDKKYALFFKNISDAGFEVEGRVSFIKPNQDASEEEAIASASNPYGIGIKVRFRKDQKLEILDSSVQSGGERSLSTFLFLLALQEGNCPFRVVDEINQGMDAQKERLAFAQLKALCEENKGCQYFMITPKLLTGLNYGEDIAVHVIYNGPSALQKNLTFPGFEEDNFRNNIKPERPSLVI
eukprot:maker-scaffold_19-snap-gene-6.3-mRNA-1 protein AED:0.03 eAED:0.03 QI:0/1/0.5/1/1/1/4/0/1092